MESTMRTLGQDDVPVGTPLMWSLLDEDGTLLLECGATLASNDERAFLFQHFRPVRGDVPVEPAAEAPLPAPAPASAGEFTLADMGLESGAQLGLRPRLQSGEAVRAARLIGVAPNRALFVALPAGRATVQCKQGEQVELVVVSRQAVFWCICTVEMVCKEPFGYLVLSEPAHIRRLRKRAAIRAQVHIPVRYGRQASESGECDGLGLARDLSTQGMGLAAPAPLAPQGSTVRVVFRLTTNDLDAELRLRAVIRTVRRDASGSTIHGLEFEGLQASEHLTLKAYVLERAYASASAEEPVSLPA